MLISLDLETTSTDVATARIVEIAMINADTGETLLDTLVNPNVPIPRGASECHSIYDADVVDSPTFTQLAQRIYAILLDYPVHLLGYNIRSFDVPVLWEELYRCGIEWAAHQHVICDAYVLYAKNEKRDLSAAAKFFLGIEHNGAHAAGPDARITAAVWKAAVDKYDLHNESIVAQAAASRYDSDYISYVDLACKLGVTEAGNVVYAFGKDKDKNVVENPGFGKWMLKNNFSENTKLALRRLLRDSS